MFKNDKVTDIIQQNVLKDRIKRIGDNYEFWGMMKQSIWDWLRK